MISIFAKRAFFNINPSEDYDKRVKPIRGGHLMRVSSIIRADQIAQQIGAKLNPTEGYENDVCVYVKPMVRKGDDYEMKGKKIYIDIVDGHNLGHLAFQHPEAKIIVCSEADQKTMSSVISNEIVLIPQHHCNFERIRRVRKETKTVGVIGTRGAFPYLPQELKQELAKRGIELKEFSKFYSRQDIIDFYMSIDLQIVWRPYKKLLSNPLKIVNAASFGIPTIALDETAFKEVEGCYLPVHDFNELIDTLEAFISDDELYQGLHQNCLDKSEKYHIENIGKLYKELDK